MIPDSSMNRKFSGCLMHPDAPACTQKTVLDGVVIKVTNTFIEELRKIFLHTRDGSLCCYSITVYWHLKGREKPFPRSFLCSTAKAAR